MAGISPACAFAQGKGFLQICKNDGSVSIIIVTPELDPYYDSNFNPDAPRTNPTLDMPDCSFCFMAKNMPALSADDAFIVPKPSLHNDQFYASAHPVHWQAFKAFDATGPPTVFV